MVYTRVPAPERLRQNLEFKENGGYTETLSENKGQEGMEGRNIAGHCKNITGFGVMAKWLAVLDVLPEDLTSIPRTHNMAAHSCL